MAHEFPKTLRFLFDRHRYKIVYGGRGGAKSWAIARALLALGTREKMLVVCGRDIQKSIKDSVHRLLADQIKRLELNDFYQVLDTEIRGRNGTEFIFHGLRHNIQNIKSLEGCDILWVEEAQQISKHTWDTVVPTIRKTGSEIWVSFNPDLEEDETYARFVIDPPKSAVVQKISYRENPWFPTVLEEERQECEKRDPVGYRNIWEGECKQAVDGAIFAMELEKANQEHRITRVPVQQGVLVMTFWDLGQSDNTAIWFVQLVGMEYRIIDYYQNNGHKMDHYFGVLAKRSYQYGDHYLPHDADYDQLAAASSIREQFEQAIRDNPDLGKTVYVVPRVSDKVLAINAARTIFDRCFFDKQNTPDGLTCLRRYHYAKDPETGKVGKEPAHNIWSHGADAFLCLAQHAKKPNARHGKLMPSLSWMQNG